MEKILILESNGPFGEALRDALAREGYEPILVKEGTLALKSIYDSLPHLILLDAVLAGADSYDILEKKQAEAMLAKIPVFMLSTDVVPINMHKVPHGSVAEFLVSLHITPAEVVKKVNRHFGKSAVVAPGAAAPKKKVLWVEDDKLIGTILSKKLINSGFDLFHAKNGDEALEMLRSVIPDAIVLDLVLPGMSGFDILQAMKKDSAVSQVPVMILSNLSKQSDIERAKALGAQKFLVKASASLDEIVQEVRGLCR